MPKPKPKPKPMLPPLNKSKCATCPFRAEFDTEQTMLEIRHSVIDRTTAGAKSQLCHGTKNKSLCRGARDFQLTLFHRLGYISAPTDEAWNAKCKELGIPIDTNSGPDPKECDHA